MVNALLEGVDNMTWRASAPVLALAILAVSSTLSDAATAASVAPVIDAGAAAALITGGGHVVVLDARAAADVALVRIRGSRFASYGDWLRRNRRDLDDPEQRDRWHVELADLGIGEGTLVVIHGARSGYHAPATVWYALQAIGLERVTVVNGGFEALVDQLPPGWLDWSAPTHGPDTPAALRLDPATPHPQAVHAPHEVKEDVLGVLATGGQQLVDARRADEFAGLDDTRNPRRAGPPARPVSR